MRERVRARERERVRTTNVSPRLLARELAARTHARHAIGQPEPVSSPQIGAGPQPKPSWRSQWTRARSWAVKRMAPAEPPPQEPLSASAACLVVRSLETMTGTPPAVPRRLPWAAPICVRAHTTIRTPYTRARSSTHAYRARTNVTLPQHTTCRAKSVASVGVGSRCTFGAALGSFIRSASATCAIHDI